MCGIIGYVGKSNAVETVYEGLKRLEYRGYDSAGAAFKEDGRISVVKKQGKVSALADGLKDRRSFMGIGHTRWATHGAPTDVNAHPHSSGKVSLVHNGIIENYAQLKAELTKDGCKFVSDTDSEVIAHLVRKNYRGDLLRALADTVKVLQGSYAVMAICEDENIIAVAKYKSPVIAGYGGDGYYCASDEPALAGKCEKISVLEDGDLAVIKADGIEIFDASLNTVRREIVPNLAVCAELGLGDCPHYMLKELREVPDSVRYTFKAYESAEEKIKAVLSDVDNIIFTGCGTAYHAGLVGKRYVEKIARRRAEAETAGEFRYKNPVIDGRTAVVAVSQSGETADTVECASLAISLGAKVIAVTNSRYSQLTRIASVTVPVAAGPEICVAATKSYTGQLTALYLFALTLAGIPVSAAKNDIYDIARSGDEVIKNTDVCAVADMCKEARGVYFMGRDLDYAVALEGSLKLKEVSYIPGEGYPAGELKHGTLALIDERTVSVFLITCSDLAEKCGNSAEQVLSRGGRAVIITNIAEVCKKFAGRAKTIMLPECKEMLSPVVTALAVQFLAYRTAVVLGRDPDKPRNLAKSVTVE